MATRSKLLAIDPPPKDNETDYPLWIRLAFKILRLWLRVYDFVAFLLSQILYGDTKLWPESTTRIQARRLNPNDLNSPWRRSSHFDKPLNNEFEGCDTMDKIWLRAVRLYGEKECLGTRNVVKIEEEMQSDGRTFGKYELGPYTWQSFNELHEITTKLGSAFLRLNVKPEDRMMIFSETRAEWMITALTCFRYKITVTTLYPTVNEDGVAHGLNECEIEVVVTSQDLAQKIINVAPRCPLLRAIVYFPCRLPDSRPLDVSQFHKVLPSRFKIITYDDFLEFGAEKLIEPPSAPLPDDVAMIMYTSGTTGQPNGVVLSHRNMVAGNAGQCYAVRGLGPLDTYVGYLPTAHILEFTAEFGSLTHGAQVGYSSPLTLTDKSSKVIEGTKGDLTNLRPTLMVAVPTIMDRIYKVVMESVNNSSPFRRALFYFCYERKRRMIERGYETPILNMIIFKKIRSILGGRLRLMLSGAAPLNAETERFMNICFCCPVSPGYGLTQTAGAGTVCEIDDISTGRVGPPLPCVDIALRPWTEGGYGLDNQPYPQGEIMLSGPNVCVSYFKNPQLDEQDFIWIENKRWLATGDIGEMQYDGCLKVIDRKKDLIKMQHGEYVSLAKVESALLTSPLVDNVCVYGKPLSCYMVALVVPNPNNLRVLARKLNVTSDNFDELRSNKIVSNAVLRELQDHSRKNYLEKFERPEKIHLCKEVWTIDSGLLTDAMKLKRKPLEKFYKDILNQLYNGYSP